MDGDVRMDLLYLPQSRQPGLMLPPLPVCVWYSREPDKPSVSPCQTSLAPAACFDFFAGGLDLISTSAPFLKTAEMAPLCAAHTLDRTS